MSDRRFPAVLLFGMPGVGKGTQGKRLSEVSGILHFSSGELFRSMPKDTDEGRFVADRLKQGRLLPDDLTITLWRSWLHSQLESGHFRPNEQILLLDGIPRTRTQCERLNEDIHVQRVIFLNPTDDAPIIERLKQRALFEGRADDADESVIRRRFEVFRHETLSVLDYYSRDVIQEIDPMGTPDEVFNRILGCLPQPG